MSQKSIIDPTRPIRALWILKPGKAEIRTESLPIVQEADSVLVQTLFSGVSRGTETLVFKGHVPTSQYAAMRAPFQSGAFPGPVKYGYSNVGQVIDGPEELLGKTIFCLYPHQTLYRVPAAAVTPLPPNLPPARAVLAANMETAVNGLWDLAPLIGERIAVIGAGAIGLLMALLCRGMIGCEVWVIDVNPAKAALAEKFGLSFALPQTLDGEFDRLIHTSANATGLTLALEHAAPEAMILEISWYGDQAVPLYLGERFHSKRLTLRASQVSTINPQQRPRWDFRRRMQLALELLCDDIFDDLINAEAVFDELPEILRTLAAEPSAVLCQRIRYDDQL